MSDTDFPVSLYPLEFLLRPALTSLNFCSTSNSRARPGMPYAFSEGRDGKADGLFRPAPVGHDEIGRERVKPTFHTLDRGVERLQVNSYVCPAYVLHVCLANGLSVSPVIRLPESAPQPFKDFAYYPEHGYNHQNFHTLLFLYNHIIMHLYNYDFI